MVLGEGVRVPLEDRQKGPPAEVTLADAISTKSVSIGPRGGRSMPNHMIPDRRFDSDPLAESLPMNPIGFSKASICPIR
jgi:hypothetical protein